MGWGIDQGVKLTYFDHFLGSATHFSTSYLTYGDLRKPPKMTKNDDFDQNGRSDRVHAPRRCTFKRATVL